MAELVSTDVVSSLSLLNKSEHSVNIGCEMCNYRESQVKKVLEDLSTAKVIIDILQ